MLKTDSLMQIRVDKKEKARFVVACNGNSTTASEEIRRYMKKYTKEAEQDADYTSGR